MTPFRAILRRTVEHVPNAVGGSFADADGEMVDAYTDRYDSHEWAVLTAHYGVVLNHLEAMFGMWHFGGPQHVFIQHDKLDVLIHVVEGGYFALFAARRSEPATAETRAADGDALIGALGCVREAVTALKKEMA